MTNNRQIISNIIINISVNAWIKEIDILMYIMYLYIYTCSHWFDDKKYLHFFYSYLFDIIYGIVINPILSDQITIWISFYQKYSIYYKYNLIIPNYLQTRQRLKLLYDSKSIDFYLIYNLYELIRIRAKS